VITAARLMQARSAQVWMTAGLIFEAGGAGGLESCTSQAQSAGLELRAK
jgi:hypothetical protein